MDPAIKGLQNILFRQMLKAVATPAWGQRVVVGTDAGVAAKATRHLSADKHWSYVFAMPRPRQFTHGKHPHDLVQPLPQSCS
jgi:hypothetical protein